MQRSVPVLFLVMAIVLCAFVADDGTNVYADHYMVRMQALLQAEEELLRAIDTSDVNDPADRTRLQNAINGARVAMKAADHWLRYLEPLAQKHINGPLPVEWETEVFEKFEKPYQRRGTGFTLAALYLDEPVIDKDSLLALIRDARDATQACMADSTLERMRTPDHFHLCNRLFLLNLASIYTTGFDCPDTDRVIPELRAMLHAVEASCTAFNASFPTNALAPEYMSAYARMIAFAEAQPDAYDGFDHFAFIRDHVDPLFAMAQDLIAQQGVASRSFMDYSLSSTARSIFDKGVYQGQDVKGIFRRVEDEATLARIDALGRKLFFDPILSGNNERSCASCHKPDQYFADTTAASAFAFDHKGLLQRNTPSLVNAPMNHLLMADGRHTTLQLQAKAVIADTTEMACASEEALRKVMSCPDYRKEFQYLLRTTPQVKEVSMEHIVSALTVYYSKFSNHRSSFDAAMDDGGTITDDARTGFNLFMSKAQCATCHFVPQFNGVKPPFIGSEFEVLGTPEDAATTALSDDEGRFVVNPARETRNAFRTGSLRNIQHTAPYMHNGVFPTLAKVIDFYDAGGGAGRGLDVPNQTLSSDSLHLSAIEKQHLEVFLNTLTETLPVEVVPAQLPRSRDKTLNARVPGGTY